MIPAFQIIAGGVDATANFNDRLLSIEVTDEDGDKADTVSIEIDNRDGRVMMPAKDTRIEVWLGFRGQPLSMMGVYAVDSLSGAGPAHRMTIGATAADLKGPIRAPRTRAWEQTTFGAIVGEIARSAGLTPAVAGPLASRAVTYEAQTAESDLHFLSRLARRLNATAKPAGGHLVVQPRGADETAAGDPMPVLPLTPGMLSSWDWQIDWRDPTDGVAAEYTDADTGERGVVASGAGKTTTRLRHVHASRKDAQEAADAAKRRADQGGLTLSAELAGFQPGALAGARVTLSGFVPAQINGSWAVTRVSHRLGGAALSTTIEARRGAPMQNGVDRDDASTKEPSR